MVKPLPCQQFLRKLITLTKATMKTLPKTANSVCHTASIHFDHFSEGHVFIFSKEELEWLDVTVCDSVGIFKVRVQ